MASMKELQVASDLVMKDWTPPAQDQGQARISTLNTSAHVVLEVLARRARKRNNRNADLTGRRKAFVIFR